MKIEVFSSKFVTKHNPNGRGVIDIDTPDGVDVFGGQEAVDKFKKEKEIFEEIYLMSKERVEAKG